MTSTDVEIIEKERHDYVLKTYFFSVFNKALTDQGVNVHLERKYMQKNGNPCYPDFYCDDRNPNKRVIFEHKGSVSTVQRHILKEISETERYLKLDDAVVVQNVILLVPEECAARFVEVADKTVTNLSAWSFDFSIDKRTILFRTLDDKPTPPAYSWLTANPIVFHLGWCSLRKFLRDEPPVVYTAEILWNIVLRSFYDHGFSFEESFELGFSDVVDVAKRFYPGGPDSAEITTERVRKALSFLDEIKWVTYSSNTDRVMVHRKRIREDLVSNVLCEEYCRTQTKTQTTLEEYTE